MWSCIFSASNYRKPKSAPVQVIAGSPHPLPFPVSRDAAQADPAPRREDGEGGARNEGLGITYPIAALDALEPDLLHVRDDLVRAVKDVLVHDADKVGELGGREAVLVDDLHLLDDGGLAGLAGACGSKG